MKCKLCNSTTYELQCDIGILYHRCTTCHLIFKDDEHLLQKSDEEYRYRQHNNTIDNEGYVNIFENFFEFINLKPNKILDYGSGPNPVFKQLLNLKGFNVDIYDPFFANNLEVFHKQYDLVTSVEVFEHFFHPYQEISKIIPRIEVDGYLAIMTHFSPSDEDFKTWWYKRDDTHVVFYSQDTFKFFEKIFPLKLIKIDNKKQVIFQKTK